MTRHWRKTAIAIAGTALVASAVGSAASASTPPASGAGGAITGYDESAKCGTPEYTGNLAKLEAVDAVHRDVHAVQPRRRHPGQGGVLVARHHASSDLARPTPTALINKPIGTGPYMLEHVGPRQPDRARGQPQLLGRRGADADGGVPVEHRARPAPRAAAVGRRRRHRQRRHQRLRHGGGRRQPAARRAPAAQRRSTSASTSTCRRSTTRWCARRSRYAIDKQRIVDNFYPKGSTAATQFLPPAIPGYDEGLLDFTYDPAKAKQLLAEAGYPDGLDVTLSYRDVARGYLAQPTPVATDIQAQLAEIGINVTLDLQESTTFIDNANGRQAAVLPARLGRRLPGRRPTSSTTTSAGALAAVRHAASPTSRRCCARPARPPTRRPGPTSTPRSTQLLAAARPDGADRQRRLGHGLQADASRTPHASPLTSERLVGDGHAGDQDQFVFVQNGEPGGLYCADETDGESLRVCEQIGESLLAVQDRRHRGRSRRWPRATSRTTT